MTDTYATIPDLTARLSAVYTVPANADQLLLKASELIDFATQGKAQLAWYGDDVDLKALLTQATCDQVEFWLEVGEEHDVTGLSGMMLAGRVQIQKLPGYLGQRPLRTLLRAGLYWAGTAAM